MPQLLYAGVGHKTLGVITSLPDCGSATSHEKVLYFRFIIGREHVCIAKDVKSLGGRGNMEHNAFDDSS